MGTRLVGFSALLFCLASPLAIADEYSAREIPAKRAGEPLIIDGKLDDAAWKDAARAEPFVDAVTGRPAPEQTQAWLLYDDKAIYIAFYCHDSQPAAIVAREIQYGAGMGDDDTVAFTIDPYYARAFGSTSTFVVNPLGTQNENIAGGRAAKREWRGVWKAAARRVSDGWTAEMRIPWEMLSFPESRSELTMGLNFSRYQARTHIASSWSNLTEAGRPEYIGRWLGVQPPHGVRVHRIQELAYVSPEWTESGHPKIHAGADIRYRPDPQMTGVLSLFPDLRNIERAVEGIQFTRTERYVGETRPFFLEGRRFFPAEFYSPRVGDFDVGAKAFGRINSRLSFGLLSVERTPDFNASVGGIQYSLAQHGQISLMGTMRRSGDPSHDGFGENISLSFGPWSIEEEINRAREGSASGSQLGTGLLYSVKHWNAGLSYGFTDPEFSPSLGFTPYKDERDYGFSTGYSSTWRTGALREVNAGLNLYHYTHLDGAFFQQGGIAYASATTRNDYALSLSRRVGRFEEAHDRTIDLGLAGSVSNRYRAWNLDYQWGLLDDHRVQSWNLDVTRRILRRMDIGLTAAILRHEQNREQYVLTLGWQFDARRSVNARLVHQDGHMNWYAAFRNAGGVGQDLYLILGDPNATSFTTRIALKWVWAN